MAKIHTHYDNLKVSRKAPPEVIRAAYKALSQKYHPDKNPNDEKSARIMAVVNSAYNALSNAQTRKEHDEWIAAEEWEIEWLESTRTEEPLDKPPGKAAGWRAAVRRRLRAPRHLLALGACVVLGWGAASVVYLKSDWLPWTYNVLGIGNSDAAASNAAGTLPTVLAAPAMPAVLTPLPAPVTRVVTLSQIHLPDLACNGVKFPVGVTRPTQSSYLPNTRIGNGGGDTQIVIDNGHNSVGVSIDLFDIEKNEVVRQAYVRAREKFSLQKLVAGNYEVRYEAVEVTTADKADCENRKHYAAAFKP